MYFRNIFRRFSTTTGGGQSGTNLNRTISNVEEQGRQDMRWLLESIGGSREVSYWLQH